VNDYGEELRKYKFAQYIMLVGNFLLPALAFLDYKNGYLVPVFAKIAAWFVSIYGSYYCIYVRKDDQRINYLLALTLFAFPVLGVIYKGDQIMGVLWSPVLPLLYMYLANMRWGLIFSVMFWLVELLAYWLVPIYMDKAPYPLEQYVMINIIYAVAFILSILYEYLSTEQAKQLRALAELDQLTQVLNRHGFNRVLQREVKRSERHQSPLSIILMDLDNFKSINDNYGHSTGDRVLHEIAELFGYWIRDTDMIGRWGGEEFAVLLPETTMEQAGGVAEKLCRRMSAQPLYEVGRVTGSFGVTQLKAGESNEHFLERVDKLMYKAKAIKKNCVVVSMDD
jgi:diguanylate cyclase (GGDEF)-like protein